MLKIQVHMNSEVEEVLAFKTCCGLKMTDQNLEILVTNEGDTHAVVPSHFDLETNTGTVRIRTLLPFPNQEIPPGDIKAFYCQMDDTLWARATRLTMYDGSGAAYSVDLGGAS